ncbi:nitrate- and nitrite sensing domain-containing protein [Sulfurospirillum sp. 1612]|uniref:nitrate- and nitrite sensing domain-containing protein n=1 Tax=Sulfurospirillum sp. 1612 TaxID=3094835 RepID=UPI002F956AA8
MRNYLARFHFISKLLLLIIPPAVIILYMSAQKFYAVYTHNKNLREVERVLMIAPHIGKLVHELQIERGLSAGYLGSKGKTFVQRLATQRTLVDAQYKSVQKLLEDFNHHAGTQKIYGISSLLQELKDVRAITDTLDISAKTQLEIYSKIIMRNINMISTFSKYSQDVWIARTLMVYVSFLHVQEDIGIERAIGTNTFENKRFSPGMRVKLIKILAQKDVSLTFFLTHADQEVLDYYENIATSVPSKQLTEIEHLLIQGKDSDIFTVNSAEWFRLISKKIDILEQVDAYLITTIMTHIKNHDAKIRHNLITIFVLNMAMIILMLLIIYYVSKTLYIENRDQQKVLLQQSKMSAMGEMIGAIAHQWRQPLNAIGVLAQEIEFKYDAGLLQKDELKTLNKEVLEHLDYMSQTINDFRDFFKPDKQKKVFDAQKAIEDALKIIGKQLEAHDISVTVKTRCDEAKHDLAHCFDVDGYEGEFKQVVINLINNAREAIEEKLKSDPTSKKEISVLIERKMSDLSIRIRDSGGGIKEEMLDSIFDIYISSKEEQQGTGLGLYMSKLIIERNMLGMIHAKNREEGAEFEILLFAAS